jgi:hypothetical protein
VVMHVWRQEVRISYLADVRIRPARARKRG